MSQQQLHTGTRPGGQPWLYLLGLFALLTAVALLAGSHLAAVRATAQGEGICVAWNIGGTWQYQASKGGYGTLSFQQAQTGALQGTFYNAATGGSGTLSGQINGQAVRFTSSANEYFEGTLDSAGKSITGTFPDRSTLEAKGTATCLRYQDPPATGTMQIKVQWGPHIYRRLFRPGAELSTQAQQQTAPPPGVPVIRFLGQTQLIIELVLIGENLPNNLRVIDLVNNQVIDLGSLTRVGETAEGGILYRGTVSVNPTGPIAPGQIEIHNVMIVDPDGRQIFAAQVIMNLIDPSGYIYDADSMAKLEGATVSCYVRQGEQWVLWDAAFYSQQNPQVSNSAGHYGWDVPQGLYKVRATSHCYRDVESAVLTIPPPRTDVHLGMQPLGCATVTIEDLWTTDDSSFAAAVFQAGQAIEFHMLVRNRGTMDKNLPFAWTTTGPDGQIIQALSGQDDYTIQPGSGLDIKIDSTVPGNAPSGVYTTAVQVTDQEQTSLKITQFQVTPAYMLPVILNNFKGGSHPPVSPTPPPSQKGIYGMIRDSNQSAANVPLDLRRYDDDIDDQVLETNTGSNGAYLFVGVPSLGMGKTYYVRYGPNTTDGSHVSLWFGPDVKSYSSGTAVAGGDFDIANANLQAPNNDAQLPLPVTFRWQKRGVSGDGYELVIFDPDNNNRWRTDDLGDTDSFTLSKLAEDMKAGKVYGWYVVIYSTADSYGYSYYYRNVTFTTSGSGSESAGGGAALRRESDPARWQPLIRQVEEAGLRAGR